ncbi:membrane protein FxsA [Bacillus pseudomycoides]|uniref:Membrane protein FxsA n=1 Tax=Bacillus pseudomycoides TaxID=64104 RepID=A0AA91V9F2_9BACI|nr:MULTISPECIES: FxsA family protein [Bacillus]PEB51351.1 membrane protein FxsA [Bacillus sp. AFS098217]PED81028.1 membrane protein FxsA [Bacillus pseudomycoides]PEU05756.1 membrane protein FxsA [Bacillus sp. AFS019443]PEU20895.1 membrane protein FxsA [Bacillus sp. AFS014408]PFW59945.1 membrane protein FxsA [Bacillus sp. AFS075034]
MKWLLVLFILIPAVEVTVLIGSSHLIGMWPTFAMIVFTAVLGAYLAKQQGFKVLREIQSRLNRGEMPGDAVIDGIFVFIGGVLLLVPGYVTDIIGFVFIFPITRRLLKPMIMKWLEWKLRRNTTIIVQK